MKRKTFQWIVLTLFMFLMYSIIIVLYMKREKPCDKMIFIKGELGKDCVNVFSYTNGMSYIELCGGDEIIIPTHRIIKIVDKK